MLWGEVLDNENMQLVLTPVRNHMSKSRIALTDMIRANTDSYNLATLASQKISPELRKKTGTLPICGVLIDASRWDLIN